MKPYSDKRWYDDPGGKSAPCTDCVYYKGYYKEKGIVVCEAFTNGIPVEVISALAHGKTGECANGFRFVKDDKRELGLLLYKPEE